jgi:hypothetical protein
MLNFTILKITEKILIPEPSSNWVSFWINFSGVLVGALLAYLIAIIIDIRQRKNEKRKEEIDLTNLNNDRLTNLSTLIDSVLSIAEKQGIEYKELADTINKKPYETHLVKITITEDIQRIKHLDGQDIFDAYTKKLSSNNQRIANFSKLFHLVDYLGLKMAQMFDMHAKHNNFTFNDQTYIRDIIDDLVTILTNLSVEIEIIDPENYSKNTIYLFVTGLLKKSSYDTSKDLAYFESEFLIPLRNQCIEMFSFNKSLAFLILEKTKRGVARFKHINYNSTQHAEACSKFKSEIEPQLSTLRELNEEIKKVE